ncbi:MAG: histidinol-phosphatase [Clostridia bacterium]|nr:histidinol-phosphatase [Clostridia bacterium]
MMPRCNLHTHTKLCDGANTAEEMVLGAIDVGCEALGFSGHSPLEGEDWCMSEADMAVYISEVLRLREKYRDRIEIYLGLEYDTYSSCDTSPFDYIIGSLHYVKKNGVMIPVDLDADLLESEIEKHYGGDFYAFARDYYEGVSSVYERTGCDIVGHFDLLAKFNGGGRFFDERSPKYREYALDALNALLSEDLIFEINTGAISRGYRREPYPADFILRHIAERGGRVMLNSDSHAADTLFCYFSEAVEYARECGVRELVVMKNGEFTSVKI